jgi:tRNA modification GTPase
VKKELIDEVLVSVFRAPNSYTGEDSVEISCHGSEFIQQKIINALTDHGARMAKPGEFTLQAFMNRKFDLSQAEAVADLIASNSSASHQLALNQMRGGYSQKIQELRHRLLEFASLIELELDFSEEDVEFADRPALFRLLDEIDGEISTLVSSFSQGNVLKKGIPVAIIGKPNVGKSTLLNAILNEERAIVSEIPGTTRDTIEDTIILEGIAFRFIDTAGLRESSDQIESMGIERTHEKIRQARIILFMFDVSTDTCELVQETLESFRDELRETLPEEEYEAKKVIVIGNKIDQLVEAPRHFRDFVEMECIFVSAKRKENIHMISDSLLKAVSSFNIRDNVIVSNTRHYEALSKALQAVSRVREGFEKEVPSDLVAIDLRDALSHLGEITGEVTNDEILGNIFSNFCIGK